MIMICNVPDEVVKNVRMGTWCGSSVAEKMITNGIPLEQIRSEIKALPTEHTAYGYDLAGALWTLKLISSDRVLEIIDKYKAESEDKE